MAKRLYLTNSAASYTPGTIRGAWDATVGSPVTIGLKSTKAGSFTRVSGTVTGTNPADYDTRFYNAVSDGIPTTGTLSGTVSWCAMQEDESSGDAYYHLHIYVTVGNSDTVRGTLLSNYIGAENWAAIDNEEGAAVSNVALSAVAVTAGDHIVVEMGIRDQDNQIFHTATVRIGYGGTGSIDLSDADSSNNHPGWFQFSDPAGVLTEAAPPAPDPGGNAEGRGGPLLPYDFDQSKLLVEIAWGANLADPDSWMWTDITCDVRSGINPTVGRNDEFSTAQPAELAFVVDNADDLYSAGPLDPNYPNVTQNTPIRVRVRVSDVKIKTIFEGYASEFTPGWDEENTDQPIVSISASGETRRLTRAKDTIQGSIRRYLDGRDFVTDWWPLDDGDGTTNGHNEIRDGVTCFTNPFCDPATGDIKGDVRWGGDTDYPATSRAVSLSNRMQLYCPITAPRYDEDGVWFFYTAFKYESDDLARIVIDSDSILGTGVQIEVGTTGLLVVEYYTFATGPTALFSYQLASWDGVWNHFGLYYDQVTTGDVFLVVNGEVVDDAPVPGLLTMRPGSICCKSTGDSGIAVSNVVIFNDGTDRVTEIAAIGAAYDAHIGETTVERITRVCAETGIPVTSFGTSTITMGPQPIGTILNVLRDCEATEQGFLYDGLGPGISFVSLQARENPVATLTIDSTELAGRLTPTADDQRLVNKVIASRSGGGTSTFEDVDGPRGSDAVGLYDDTIDVSCQADRSLLDYAGWLVHLGTAEGYRFPEIELNFRSTPGLAEVALDVVPGSVIAVTTVSENLPGIPDEELLLIVEGVEHDIPNPLEWTVRYKCSPALPWNVGILANLRSDIGEYLVHLDTEGSQLNSGAALGASSLSVATTSGPLWSTDSDDFPVQVEVLGIPITVTAISGSSSPQTFTVTGSTVTKALASGATVHALAPVIAL